MKIISRDEFELSSGRKIYAHRHMLSIGEDDSAADGFAVGYGADGDIHTGPDYTTTGDVGWSLEERHELANHAIELWQRYRDNLK